MPVKRYIEQVDRSRFYFWDDFGAANFDDRTWGYGGSAGGSITKLAALGGQIRVTVGGTAGNEYYIVQDTRLNYKHPTVCTWRIKIEDRTYSAQQFGLQTDGTHYIQLRSDTAVGLNWLARCQNGGSYTEVDTGRRVDPNVWVELMIITTSTEAQFFIDGHLVATITTNVPPGAFGPITYLYRNSGGSGTRSCLVDWIELSGARD